jgi:serine/alanine adding enzyme
MNSCQSVSAVPAHPEVVACDDFNKAKYEAFVENSPVATMPHLYGWRRVITGAYGHSSFYLVASQDNEVSGVLPLVWVKSRLFGNILASMPFLDYGGIVAANAESAQALYKQALLLREQCGADRLELRHREALLEEGTLRQDKSVLLLDISPGSETLWKSFGAKVRNQVRKAEKCGLHTQFGGSELLEDFYRVFTVNMRDLGSPVHHPIFFSKIFSEFGDKAGLFLVKEGNRTIGGLICLFHRDTVLVPWASCLRESFSKCPNNLLYWDAIQLACSRGCKTFDFGRSTIDSGTYKFKLQWGARPVNLNWQLFYRRAQLQATSQVEDPKLQMASKLWRRLPLPLTTWLGPVLRKSLVN